MMSPLMSRLGPKKSGSAIPESSLARSSRDWFHAAERGPTARGHEEGPVSLCEDNHSAMKANEATWQAARFEGYQPLGFLLGELRICPVCKSMVLRLIRFTAALSRVLDHLLRPQRPDEIYVHAAAVLASWAQSNVPEQLGIVAPPQPQDQPALCNRPGEGNWRQLGQELRQWREHAGLSRAQLSALSGVADSTIRNCETGRHRPRTHTLHRLSAVPAIRSDSAGSQPVPTASAESESVNPM